MLEDFTLDNTAPDEYLHDICLCNRDTGQIFYDKLSFTYIKIRNFVKTEADLETDLDRWLHVLKHLSSQKQMPAFFRKSIFEKLFNIAEYINLTKEEKAMYDSSLKYKWDNQNRLDYAINEARMEERKKAENDIAIERRKTQENIAIELKKEGLANEFIAKTTGLSVEEIEKV